MPHACAIYRADWQLLQSSYSVQFNIAQLNTLYTTYLHTPKLDQQNAGQQVQSYTFG